MPPSITQPLALSALCNRGRPKKKKIGPPQTIHQNFHSFHRSPLIFAWAFFISLFSLSLLSLFLLASRIPICFVPHDFQGCRDRGEEGFGCAMYCRCIGMLFLSPHSRLFIAHLFSLPLFALLFVTTLAENDFSCPQIVFSGYRHSRSLTFSIGLVQTFQGQSKILH